MRVKLKSTIMALVVLLQVAVAPLSTVNAATTGEATATDTSAVTNVDQQTDSRGSQSAAVFSAVSSSSVTGKIDFTPTGNYVTSGRVYAATSHVIAGNGVSFQAGKVRISLAKKYFKQPIASDITASASSITGSSITSDEDNYYIWFDLATVSGDVGLPFSVRTADAISRKDKVTLTQDIYDANNQLLNSVTSTPVSVSVGNPTNSSLSSPGETYKSNEIDANGVTLAPKAGVIRAYFSPDVSDDQQYTFSITLTNDMDFDPAQTTGWTYDAATRTASYTGLANYNTSIPSLQVIYRAGLQTGPQAGDYLQYNVKTVEGSYVKSGKYWYYLKSEVDNWSIFWDRILKFDATGKNSATLADVANNRGTSMTIQPIDEDSARTMPAGTKVGVGNVYEKLTSSARAYQQPVAVSLSGLSSYSSAMTHNKVIGTKLDGTQVVLATNITAEKTEIPQALQTDYKMIELDYDDPAILTYQTHKFAFTIYSQLKDSGLEKFKHSNASQLVLSDGSAMNYTEPKNHNIINNQTDPLYLYKYKNDDKSQPASLTTPQELRINVDGANTAQLYSGHILNAMASFSVNNNLNGTQLRNPKVYFILPDGLSYAAEAVAQDATQLIGLKDVSVQANFNNSGKVAIIGTPTQTLAIGNTALSFSIPLQASKMLRQGDYRIEAYLIFANNDGSYDLSNVSGTDSIIMQQSSAPLTSYRPEDQYGLNKDSNDPTAIPAYARGDFTYTPPQELISANMLKETDSDTYVADIGNSGRAGDKVDYRVNLFNNGQNNIGKLGVIDPLPTKGDQHGSEFNVTLTGPITIKNGTNNTADYTNAFNIYYSTSTPKVDQATYQNTKLWTQTPTDFSKVTMVKLELKPGQKFLAGKKDEAGKTISGDEVNFDFPAQLATTNISQNTKALNYAYSTQDSGQTYLQSSAAIARIGQPTSELQILKVDQKTQAPLYGAEFGLYDYQTDQRINPESIYQTNSQGKLNISGLTAGHYYVKEIKAPANYSLPTDRAAEKEANQLVIPENKSTQIKLTITNVPKQSLIIKKIAADSGAKLSGAVFNIVNSQGQLVSQNLVTGSDGSVVAYGLPAGEYNLIEVKAPAGYQLAQAMAFSIKDDAAANTITVADAPISGVVKLINTDKMTHQPLTGSHFNLYQLLNGREILVTADLLTDQTGQLTASSLLIGRYRLRQTEVSRGYQLNDTNLDFDITAQHTFVNLQLTNQQQSVQPVTPTNPATPQLPTKPLKVVPQPDKTSKAIKSSVPHKNQQNLPQANEKSDQRLRVIGLFILLVLATPFIFKKLTDQ